ncbi:MAG: PepSY-associated TM helix domain-containing protein, partial [Rhodospirillaceae bacterium]
GGPRPGQGIRVTVDPATLAPAVAKPPSGGFARLMHDIHGNLLISGFGGRQFVGWLGVFMTGLGLSGIVIWWPKRGQWRRAFTVKLSGGLLRAAYDLHRLFGICTLLVFMIVCISGVYIVFPQAINSMTAASPQVRDARNQVPMPVTPVEGEAAMDADAVVELARGAAPDGILRTVTIPASPRQPYRVAFSKAGDQMGAPMVAVVVDPWAKRVMDVRDPDAYAANDKFLVWQRALHSGSGLGTVWWVLVFISGLLPPLFAVTGVTMWWMRRKGRG